MKGEQEDLEAATVEPMTNARIESSHNGWDTGRLEDV